MGSIVMDCWTMAGRKVLSSLIRQDDFMATLAINNHSALLEFRDKGCLVKYNGDIAWIDDGIGEK